MTENSPRHLNDITAQMPAIPRVPQHARPETSELRAQRPLPPVPASAPRRTRAESRRAKKLPWWKRWLGLTK